MQPLSPWLYFLRNPRSTLPVLGVIALAVVGVVVVGVLADSQVEAPRRDYVVPAQTHALVMPRKGILDPNLAATLRTNPDVARVLRVLPASVRSTSLFGSQPRPVRGLPESDMDWFLDALGMRLTEGRLPQGSRNEIALHSSVLLAKGLELGDFIGYDLDPDEWLPGAFEIVGRLDGPVELGVTTAAALRRYTDRAEVLMLFAQPGRMGAIDEYVRSLEGENIEVSTITTQTEKLARETRYVTPMLAAVTGVTILVLSLAAGLLNQVHFLQRLGEYGVLMALGYKLSYLIRRTLTEAGVMTVAGWILGLGLAHAVHGLLRTAVFDPRGITLVDVTQRNITATLPIPLLVAVFSLFTVIRRLMAMDPVSIVERRD